jgi:hypothetical protein
MTQRYRTQHYDVLVVGAGSAGVAAAVASARNGARTLLVDSGPMIGGELLSGIPINAVLSARGEWVVGGVIRELLDECAAMGGLVPPYFDWRSLWLTCVDPEVMKLAVNRVVKRSGAELMLYSFAEDVVLDGDRIAGVVVLNKSGRWLITADVVIDASGDGDIAVAAGAPWEKGGTQGEFQPVTMIFRLCGVETTPLLEFVRDNLDNVALGECLLEPCTKAECAEALLQQGLPSVFFDGNGPLVRDAVRDGRLFPCGILAICPLAPARREVSVNTTRIANVDATETAALSRALPDLFEQVWACVRFLQRSVPGFESAQFSGVAPRIGIRETRRILGEYVLTGADVLAGRKRDDGICKGAHELDVHGAGSAHRREMIRDGGSYDVPFGCLLPRGTTNLLVAGRCLSATREAHGSARVMGTCMGMGQAAGTAAALCAGEGIAPRSLGVARQRDTLRAQGAELETRY